MSDIDAPIALATAAEGQVSQRQKAIRAAAFGALILLAIAALGVSLRHIFQIPRLDDEIDEVQILGLWFASHLAGYLLQWQMYAYPPQSPVFGNGFLPSYLFGAAIHFSGAKAAAIYVPARLVNFSLTILSGLFICRYLWDKTGKYFAVAGAALYWCFPVAIYGASTGYGEPLLATVLVAALLLLDTGDRSIGLRRASLLGAVIGIGLLTKLSIAVAWAWILIYLLARAVRRQERFSTFIPLIVVPMLTAWIIWPGAREVSQLKAIYAFLFLIRDNMGLLPEVSRSFNLQSYTTMLLATLPPAVPIIAASSIVYLCFKQFFAWRWTLILAFIASYLLFLGYFVHGSTRHQIITLQPFVAVLTVLVVSGALGNLLISRKQDFSAIASVCLAILAALSLLTLPGPTLGLYVSAPANAMGLQRYFLSGSGELQTDAAAWIMSHSKAPYAICDLAQDIDMMVNAPAVGHVMPAFTTDGRAQLAQRGCRYVLLYDSYFKGDGRLVNFLRTKVPVHRIQGEGASVLIYEVRYQQRAAHVQPCADCAPPPQGVRIKALGQSGFIATFDLPGAYRAAAVTVLREPLPMRTATVNVDFDVVTAGCSEMVVDLKQSAEHGWPDGGYDRIFAHRDCAPSKTHISETIPLQSESSPFIGMRLGTDNRFGPVQHMAVKNLRISVVTAKVGT